VNALARSTFHRLEVLALISARLLRGITMHSESGNWAAINESRHQTVALRSRQTLASLFPLLPFYRDQIMGKEIRCWQRMFPVLAVCRIGEADTDLIAEMKRRYNSVDFQGGGIWSTIRRHFL
jgi:hypothetical protein